MMANSDAAKHSPALRQIPRELSVFINCPYDEEYEPIFYAVLLAALACGFFPRAAVELGVSSMTRIERISNLMIGSKYSIHDLTRCRGEGDSNLARFNMPLELGMALGIDLSASTDEARHEWLVMVPDGHSYIRFISDLAGFDPQRHDATVESVVSSVMAWLAMREDADETPTPAAVLTMIPEMMRRMESLSRNWHGRPPWKLRMKLVKEASDEILGL